MGEPAETKDAPRFHPNEPLQAQGLAAPLPVEANTRRVLTGVFKQAIETVGAPPALVEPASSTGGGLIHACQEYVMAANRLLSDPPKDLTSAVRAALWASRDFQGASQAAYALRQATEGRARSEANREPDRLKGYGERLERRFEELGLPVRMDPVRFAILQVQLDELYDHAARHLQRFYRAIRALPDVGPFCAFAPALADCVVKEIVPDQVLAVGAGPERQRTGLMDLLPELEREFL